MRDGNSADRGSLGRPFEAAQSRCLPRGICCLALAGSLLPSPAGASSLLVPAAGSADSASAGATIAEPLSAPGAQFSNPAGLAGFEDLSIGFGLGFGYGQGEVTADDPAGYHADNEVLVPFLNGFLTVPYGRWTFGIGTMGTSGARFDYGARPAIGVNDGFFSETGIAGVPITAAFRVTDSFWLGAEIIPLYGSTHLRYSRPVSELGGAVMPFRFTVDGFGVQAMFGATWKPTDAWTVGGGVRPPGRIWAEGDTKFGATKQDVDLEVEAPFEISLGVTRSLATAWKVSYGFRFVDTSVFAKSFIRFEATPSANTAYLHGARDEWRHALGLSYEVRESWTLYGGVMKANGIVSSKGVSPASYDSTDWRISTGLRWQGDRWTIDGAFGFLFGASRRVSASDALVFPGRYESEPAFLLSVMLTRKF